MNLFKEGLNAVVDPDHKFVSIQYLAENGEQKQIRVKIGDRQGDVSIDQERDVGGVIDIRNP